MNTCTIDSRPFIIVECSKIPDVPEPRVTRYIPFFAFALVGDPTSDMFTGQLYDHKHGFDALKVQRNLNKWREKKLKEKYRKVSWSMDMVNAYGSDLLLPFGSVDLDFESYFEGIQPFIKVSELPFIRGNEQTLLKFKKRVRLQADFMNIIFKAHSSKQLTKADRMILDRIAIDLS